MNRFEWWNNFLLRAFKHEWVCRLINPILDHAMTNMSICRNSTVIPIRSAKVNVSHFCTGGVSWGGNRPDSLISGMPAEVFQRIKGNLDYPQRLGS